jgi:hypothetical protein
MDPHETRIATLVDAEAIGALLDRFNREFGEPTPGPEVLAARIAELIDSGETDVVLAGQGPVGWPCSASGPRSGRREASATWPRCTSFRIGGTAGSDEQSCTRR